MCIRDSRKDALEKLQLNDASLSFEPETSAALGFGFRCGFLGLLHMEIITERLEREFDLDLITTTPGVQYRLTLTDGTVEIIDNPSAYPDPTRIEKAEEPFVNAHIYTPNDYVGPLMDLCQQKRGVLVDMKYMDETRVDLHYQLPLGEIVYDFFDAIKSRSRGYASYDYEWDCLLYTSWPCGSWAKMLLPSALISLARTEWGISVPNTLILLP